jgi:hypothetical protein
MSAQGVSVKAELTISDFFNEERIIEYEPVSGGTGINDIWNICDIEIKGTDVYNYTEINQISKTKTSIDPED